MDTESFSKTKAMELPRNVVVGHDALHAVGEVCQSLKLGKRALIVADETTMKIAGMTVERELAAQTPIAVIMDTGVIAESPFRLLASGCGDIISNLAAVKDWALARNLRNEYYSSYAAALSELAAHLVIENASTIKPRLEESAWFVVQALVHAHAVNKERYTILGDEGLTLEAAERLAKITKVV